MSNNKILIDKDNLYRLYHHENKSLKEISILLGCSIQTILNRMKEFDIDRRSVFEASKFIVHTKEWGDRISIGSRGKKLSNETKEKIRQKAMGRKAYNKGLRKCTHPRIVKGGCSREKHWNWKGGVSSENNLLRQSSQYKTWRDSVFKRDKWICVKCKKEGYVEAHHIKQFSNYPELRFDVNNGVTLCQECHKIATNEQKRCIQN